MKLKNMFNKLVKSVEGHTPLLVKAAIGLGIIYIVIMFFMLDAANKERRITESTVMVLSMNGGGGSGVIIYNSPHLSKILTNNHVCEVVKNGGKIRHVSGKEHLVSTVTQSQMHDICLITVQADFGVSAKVASKASTKFSESSIAGHPSLLPAVVSKGHVSSNQIISVFMGVRACSDEEKEDEQSKMICLFFNGMPVIKTFDALLITAMIMPGSSGSAVYNDNGELAGLAFAGSQGLSYAYTVPFEYVKNFLDEELQYLDTQIVNYEQTLLEALNSRNSRRQYFKYIVNKCDSAPLELEETCKIIKNDIKFRGELL